MNLQKTCNATFKAIGDGLTKFTAIITTHAIDRDQDVVIPSGMNSKEYESNPVLLYSHDPNKPIGKMVTMRRGESSIDADFVLAPRPDTHEGEWLPDTVGRTHEVRRTQRSLDRIYAARWRRAQSKQRRCDQVRHRCQAGLLQVETPRGVRGLDPEQSGGTHQRSKQGHCDDRKPQGSRLQCSPGETCTSRDRTEAGAPCADRHACVCQV